MIMEPLVSVLMTAYNREQYIAEAIESVLCSDFTAFELIIVDDCSTDNTYSIAEEYARKDNRVRLYRNKKNLGQFANRNYAASLAKTDLLKYFDSDDVLYPHGLGEMVKVMQQFPEAVTAAEFKTTDLNKKLPVLFSPHQLYINHFLSGNLLLYVGPSGSIFRKEYFFKAGMFDEQIGILADTLLMLRLASLGPAAGFSTDLFYWRTHDGQVTVGQQNKFEMIRQRYEINYLVLSSDKCPLQKDEKEIIIRNVRSLLVRQVIRYFFQTGSLKETKKLLRFGNISFKDFVIALIRRNKKV